MKINGKMAWKMAAASKYQGWHESNESESENHAAMKIIGEEENRNRRKSESSIEEESKLKKAKPARNQSAIAKNDENGEASMAEENQRKWRHQRNRREASWPRKYRRISIRNGNGEEAYQ
jgi:hypothetical protein